ncbi:hypothetical protein BGW38_008157, partial [Lunasporangiospora selenospora]
QKIDIRNTAPGSFNSDDYRRAKLDGKGEEFVKSNYTFCCPFSQLGNKKKWVYRD